MEYVELGKRGLRISAVGIGMWQAAAEDWGKDVTDDSCLAAIHRAHELGVNLVDTAEVYGDGHSEEVVGRAVKEIGRDEFIIATKFGGHHFHADQIRRACEGSLKRLGVSEIDLYQAHWRDPCVPFEEPMRALEALHREGKIRAIGVCNFSVRDLEEARSHLSRTDIVENQVHLSLLERDAEREIVPYCRKEGIAILAWSPLEKGLLTGKYRKGHKPSDHVRKDRPLFRDANLSEIAKLVKKLARIGKAHGRTPAQVALNWLLRQPGRVVPIPGAKTARQAEENTGAVGWRLSDAEVRELSDQQRALVLDTF